jgi:hypothetical protein
MGADGVEVNAPAEVLSPKCLQSHWAYFETLRPSITNQHQTYVQCDLFLCARVTRSENSNIQSSILYMDPSSRASSPPAATCWN